MAMLVYAAIGSAIVLYSLVIDDRIERFACARDGRSYSPIWFLVRFRSPLRIADARDAGS